MSMVVLPGLRSLIQTMSQERNLPPEVIQNALQEALLKGYERYRRTQNLEGDDLAEDYFDNFEVRLDLKKEGFRVVARKKVVKKVTNSDHEIDYSKLPVDVVGISIGDRVVVDMTPDQKDFGRFAALQTKQVFTQRLQQQQCQLILDQFLPLKGAVLSARVLRYDRRSIIVAVRSAANQAEVEAELPKYEQLPSEQYLPDKTFMVYLKKVFDTPRSGPQLRVSRATSHLISGLFTKEVPEIQSGQVEIKAVARDAVPSSESALPLSKIAVDTEDETLDPIAVCLGENGSRKESVRQQLGGDQIDIIRWSASPETYIANALTPAEIAKVEIINAEELQAEAFVAPDQLPLAIGLEEQNLRLANRLTGWNITVKPLDTAS